MQIDLTLATRVRWGPCEQFPASSAPALSGPAPTPLHRRFIGHDHLVRGGFWDCPSRQRASARSPDKRRWEAPLSHTKEIQDVAA